MNGLWIAAGLGSNVEKLGQLFVLETENDHRRPSTLIAKATLQDSNSAVGQTGQKTEDQNDAGKFHSA